MTMAIDPVAAPGGRAPRSRPLPLVSWLRARTLPRAIHSRPEPARPVRRAGWADLRPRPAPAQSPRRTSTYGASACRARRRRGRAAGAPQGPAAPARRGPGAQLEDEILYREGLRLGLDRNDGIVRARRRAEGALPRRGDRRAPRARRTRPSSAPSSSGTRSAGRSPSGTTSPRSSRTAVSALAPARAAGDPLPGGRGRPGAARLRRDPRSGRRDVRRGVRRRARGAPGARLVRPRAVGVRLAPGPRRRAHPRAAGALRGGPPQGRGGRQHLPPPGGGGEVRGEGLPPLRGRDRRAAGRGDPPGAQGRVPIRVLGGGLT